MKSILIIMLSFALDGGATSKTIEFKSHELCETARKAVLTEFYDSKHDWGRRNILAVCVDQ